MKFFTKKNIAQKMIIAIVIVILCNFIVPNISRAKDDWGGVLFSPIQALVLSLGDITMYIVSATLDGDLRTDNIITLSTHTTTQKVTKTLIYIATGGLAWVVANKIDKNESWINIPKVLLPEEKVDLPLFTVTPEKIFSNDVPFLDINIINPSNSESASGKLQATVSSWYSAIRNLAIVGMLSVLVYVGIRIIISSTATDKAKYKQFIKDWLIAICLLFFMHYIMSFAITMVNVLTKSLKNSIDVPVLNLDLSDYNLSYDHKAILIRQQILQDLLDLKHN